MFSKERFNEDESTHLAKIIQYLCENHQTNGCFDFYHKAFHFDWYHEYHFSDLIFFQNLYNSEVFHTLKPRDREGSKKELILGPNSILVHQTSIQNSIKILKNKSILAAKEFNKQNYIGQYIYFGVLFDENGFDPYLSPSNKILLDSLCTRYGSVSFIFKYSDVFGNDEYYKYFLGERQYSREHCQPIYITKKKKSFLCKSGGSLKLKPLIVSKWDIIYSDGGEFTHPEVVIDKELDLSEFQIKLTDHTFCVKEIQKKECLDCDNYNNHSVEAKKKEFNKLLDEDINNKYTINYDKNLFF